MSSFLETGWGFVTALTKRMTQKETYGTQETKCAKAIQLLPACSLLGGLTFLPSGPHVRKPSQVEVFRPTAPAYIPTIATINCQTHEWERICDDSCHSHYLVSVTARLEQQRDLEQNQPKWVQSAHRTNTDHVIMVVSNRYVYAETDHRNKGSVCREKDGMCSSGSITCTYPGPQSSPLHLWFRFPCWIVTCPFTSSLSCLEGSRCFISTWGEGSEETREAGNWT